MTNWLQSPWVVDAIIVLTLAEGAALWMVRRVSGRGPQPGAWLPNLAAGLCLLLALRAALHAAWWPWLPLALAGAGIAHALDLRARWRSSA